MDDGAIQRLSERIAASRAQQASITQAESPRQASIGRAEKPAPASIAEVAAWGRGSSTAEVSRRGGDAGVDQAPASPAQGVRRESLVGRILRERKELEAQRANERGRSRE